MKKLLLLTLWLIHLSVFSADVDVWRAASAFTQPSPWSYSDSADSPYGSWFHQPGLSSTTTSMSIDVGSVPAGNYMAFIYTVDYDKYWRTFMDIGTGTSVTNYTSDRDWNGNWSLGTVLTAPLSFTNINITWSNTLHEANKTRIMGVVLTSDTNATMLSSHHYIDLIPPDPSSYDVSANDNLNLIPNGSFEAGFRGGFGLFSNSRTLGHLEVWDNTFGLDSRASLKMDVTNGQLMQIIFRPIVTKTNKIYTFSFWAKSSRTNNFGVQIKNTISAPTNVMFTPTLSTNRLVAVGTNWTWVAITNIILEYPYSEVTLIASVTGVGSRTTNWFDNFKFSNGSDSTYVAEAPVDLAIWTGKLGQIHYSDESTIVPIKLHNTTSGSLNGNVHVKVFDYNNNVIVDTIKPYLLSSNSTNSVYVTLPQGKQGHFRILAYDPINGGVPDEITITVLPRPRVIDVNDAKIGSHSASVPWIWQVYTNMGLHWTRSLSPGAYFRWSIVEATDNVYTWHDAEIALINQYEIRQLANIHIEVTDWAKRTFFRTASVVGEFIPTEAVSSDTATGYVAKVMFSTNFTSTALFLSNRIGTFVTATSVTGAVSGATATISGAIGTSVAALDRWPQYLTNLISHYTTVTNWEVGNEPNQSSTYMMQDSGIYSEFLRNAVDIIRSIQPDAHIMALGGVLLTNWAGTVLSNMTACGVIDEIDSVSFHWYSGNEGGVQSTVDLITVGWNKPVYGTETGVWDHGAMSSWNSSIRREGKPVEYFRDADRFYIGIGYNAAILLRNIIETLGDGAKRVFAYDGRAVHTPGYYDTEPSMFEYNDSLKPVGAALSVAAYTLDGTTTMGRCTTNSNLRGFTWDAGIGTNTIVSLYSKAPTNIFLVTMPVTLTNYVRKDIFGNPIATNEASFILTHEITYLSFTNVATYVHTNMTNATYVLTSDTVAPTPMISLWPANPVSADTQYIPVRWFAKDNKDKPNTGLTANALTYSIKLDPVHSDWQTPSANTMMDLAGYDAGFYTLHVSAIDSSGNSNEVSQSFWIGPVTNRVAGTATSTTAQTIYIK